MFKLSLKFIALVTTLNFLVVGSAFAQTAPLDPLKTITAGDLGIENSGLLPTNPFYFFKEWGRGVERLFTFNSVSKVELELRISDEKASEAKKVQELKPDDSAGIRRAIKNYQNSQERLKIKLGELATTSQNPNLDRLLENITERSLKHAQIFSELDKKLSENPELKNAISGAKNSIESIVAVAAQKEDPSKFASRLERAISDSGAGELKNARSLEIVTQIQKQLPEEAKNSLEKLRENFSEKVKEELSRPIIKPLPIDAKTGCEKLKYKISELKSQFEKGTLSEAEYQEKLASASKDLESCEQRVPAPYIPRPIPAIPIRVPAESMVCTQQYEPVCGEDGKTYSNSCFATASEVSVKYKGECGNEYKEPVSAIPLPAVPVEKVEPAE
ncbi:MAG: DUF5667 domain-containing protein [bacterium]|nr:DUF5667 domain-containing protein [bacterium]